MCSLIEQIVSHRGPCFVGNSGESFLNDVQTLSQSEISFVSLSQSLIVSQTETRLIIVR